MHITKSIFAPALVLLVALVVAVGCTSTADTSQQASEPSTDTLAVAVNTHCPIMGGKVTDEGGRAEWNGKTVGFCCPDCIAEWNALSDDEKVTKLAEAGEGSLAHHPEGTDHD